MIEAMLTAGAGSQFMNAYCFFTEGAQLYRYDLLSNRLESREVSGDANHVAVDRINGRVAVVSTFNGTGRLAVYDVNSLAQIRSITVPNSTSADRCRFSPNGQYLALVGNATSGSTSIQAIAQVYRTSDWSLLLNTQIGGGSSGNMARGKAPAFSADSSLLSFNGLSQLAVFTTSNFAVLKTSNALGLLGSCFIGNNLIFAAANNNPDTVVYSLQGPSFSTQTTLFSLTNLYGGITTTLGNGGLVSLGEDSFMIQGADWRHSMICDVNGNVAPLPSPTRWVSEPLDGVPFMASAGLTGTQIYIQDKDQAPLMPSISRHAPSSACEIYVE